MDPARSIPFSIVVIEGPTGVKEPVSTCLDSTPTNTLWGKAANELVST